MNEVERVREQIAEIIADKHAEKPPCIVCYGLANAILSLEVEGKTLTEWIELLEQGKVAVLDDDQSYPDIPREDIVHIIMQRDQQLREAGFKKVVQK